MVDKLTGTHQPRGYCVQYRETDFNFVCRLMEEEGIFFWFAHSQSKHDLVLADDPGVRWGHGEMWSGLVFCLPCLPSSRLTRSGSLAKGKT